MLIFAIVFLTGYLLMAGFISYVILNGMYWCGNLKFKIISVLMALLCGLLWPLTFLIVCIMSIFPDPMV